jgi:hypothetical protein
MNNVANAVGVVGPIGAIGAIGPACGGIAGAAPNSLMGQQMGQSGYAQAQISVADLVAADKKRMFAKAEILEHIEAQIRMDLWKDESLHKQIFEDAMQHAIKRILERPQ